MKLVDLFSSFLGHIWFTIRCYTDPTFTRRWMYGSFDFGSFRTTFLCLCPTSTPCSGAESNKRDYSTLTRTPACTLIASKVRSREILSTVSVRTMLDPPHEHTKKQFCACVSATNITSQNILKIAQSLSTQCRV